MALKVVAIIQARMGSSRLPGKMGMDLHGMPVIDWVLKRTKLARRLQEIVLATTEKSEDDFLEDAGNKNGVVVFRGNEKDVLRRFVDAGNIAKADLVVRVCGDRPLIDPSLVDLAIEHFLLTGAICLSIIFQTVSITGLGDLVWRFCATKIWSRWIIELLIRRHESM